MMATPQRSKMAKHRRARMRKILWALLLALICCVQPNQARDACYERPWSDPISDSSQTVVISLASFEELQHHIDNTTGPTVFAIKPAHSSLLANKPVLVNKPDITITAAAEAPGNTPSNTKQSKLLAVDCTPAGSLLHIRAPGFRLLGLHVTGCSATAVQLSGAKRALIRNCSFTVNTAKGNSSSGGAVSATRSQLWLDSCTLRQNTAQSGGAVAATSSQVLITDCNFVSNRAELVGGAVTLQGRADAAVTGAPAPCWKDIDGVLEGVNMRLNSASLHGGALATNGSHVVITGSTAAGNVARYGGVLYAGQAANVVVRGHSSMTNNTASSSGGVVYALGPGVHVVLKGSTFAANTADILGGVISAKDAAAVRLDSSTFASNIAQLAAGVLYARDADLTASGSTFSSNSAARDGGALYCASNCIWTLKNSIFRDNKCSANGGAVFGWNVAVKIDTSSLDGNEAGALGGAISVANSTFSMHGSKLGSNSASGVDAAGGGLYSQGSNLNLTDNIMNSNKATWGGAVYVTNSTLSVYGGIIGNSSVTGSGAAVYALRSQATLVDVRVERNDAAQYGGSLYCHYSACSMLNCDISRSTASLGAGCVWAGYGSVSFRGSHFEGCLAKAEGGGGLQAISATNVSVVGCSFTSCSALKGAGGGLELDDVKAAAIKGTLFAANRALIGGSIALHNTSLSVSGSSLLNSTATVGGCIAASAGSSISMFNGTAIAGNAAAVGGGIAMDNSNLSITRPVVVSFNKALAPVANTSSATGPAASALPPTAEFGGQAVLRGIGGGIYAHASTVLGSGLRLDNNKADRVGGGGYWDRVGISLNSSSISHNLATEEAGGLKLINPAQGSLLESCVIAANWAGVRAGGLGIVGVDLVSELALVEVQLVNNTAAGEAGGGLLLSGPLGLLMVGGEVSGNAAGAAAATGYSSNDDFAAADLGSTDAFTSSTAGSQGLKAAGGGVLFEGCSWAAMRGVDVWGNAAPAGCGGGVAVDACSKFLLDGATIEGNVAASGGGVCTTGLPGYFTVHNSSISSNRALLGGVWGGLGSTLSPTPEPHLSCRIPGTGGGLCVEVQGHVLINGSTISRNQARNGGAMALGVCDDTERCALGMLGATFTNNTAVQGGGGAVYFTTAVAPDQVLCGEDYNSSEAVGYASGTTFTSLSAILSSASFSSSAANTATIAPFGSSVNSGSDDADARASTSGSIGSGGGGGSSSSDSSMFVPGGGSSENDDGTLAETESFDPTAAGASATTVTFSTARGEQQEPKAASSSADATPTSGLRVSDSAVTTESSTAASATTSVEMGALGSGSSDDEISTEGFDPTAVTANVVPTSTASATVAETESLEPSTVETAGFDPTSSETAGFDPTALGTSTVSFDPAAADAGGGELASTESFDPSSIGTSVSADFAAASGDAADDYSFGYAGFDPTAAGTTAADVSTFGIASVPTDVNMQQQLAATTPAEAAYQSKSAEAASAVAPKPAQFSPESGQHGDKQQAGRKTAATDMGTLSSKLGDATESLQLLQPPKEKTHRFVVGNGLTASTTEFTNAESESALADALVGAAAATADVSQQASLPWGANADGFNPYTMTCDPVQNPAACPVPKFTSTDAAGKQAKDVMTAQAAAAAAAMAATGVALPAAASSMVASANASNGRRLMEIDEAAAANEAAAAVEAAIAAAGQPSGAPATGLILSGTSQCGTFESNTAIGAKSYGPVVTSRPAALRVWDSTDDLSGPNPVRVATGGQVQVQIQVVDVFGGVVTSGATEYIRVRATLQNPRGSSLADSTSLPGISSSSLPGLGPTLVGVSPTRDGDSETDTRGVILSGMQQLTSRNGSLILSGLKLSGPPGTNTTLYFEASDPSLLPASVAVSLTSCSAGFMQLPGTCQPCPQGTYSFDPDEPRCALCPANAMCNGTVVVPVSGYWHSSPRSVQIHACFNPAACTRDNTRKQHLMEWQYRNYGTGMILGKPKDQVAKSVGQYMQDQCAPGYEGTLCANCAQNPAAVADNRVSHGKVAGSCVECGDQSTLLGMYILARLYDLALWAALTWLAWRAAKAWANAVTLNPSTAAATAGSLPPSSAAAASLSARMGNGEKGSNGMVLATSEAAAAAAAGVSTSAPLHAHVNVFLDYLQMLSIISCSVASYSWPKTLQTFMTGFTFVPLGTSKWVAAECLLPHTLSYRRSIVGLLITAALPLFYLLTSAAVWIGCLALGKTHRTPILALVVGTGLFYPLITMSALSAFSCTYIDSPRIGPGEMVSSAGSYWTLDPELKCYEGQHLQLMLGFGLPVVLLVVLAWPLLLASMLWDSRFRIREQQQHPATRRRYLVRKTIKLCHQLLGVMSGFVRPRMYLWPVAVEVRKLLLCVVVVLASGSAPAVQLYVLWGLLALVLLLEWWARARSTWALVGLQLIAIGALQAVVYLAAAFTQTALAGATPTFTALIICVALSVAVAFLLSLIAGLRGNSWLRKVLDVDNDGKISSADLYQSATKLLHLNVVSNTPAAPGKCIHGEQQNPGGSKLVTSSTASSKISTWRLVFVNKVPGLTSKAGSSPKSGNMDAPAPSDSASGHDDAVQQSSDQRRAPSGALRSPAASQAGRVSGRGLAAGSLPITDATGGGIMASSSGSAAVGGTAAAAATAAAVPTSASIDIGALGALRRGLLAKQQQQQPGGPAIAPGSASVDSSIARAAGYPAPLPPGAHVAVDLQQLSGPRSARSAAQGPISAGGSSGQQQLAAAAAAASRMTRANSAGASVPGNMPLQTYLSVHQWLTESEELSHGASNAGSAGWAARGSLGSGACDAPRPPRASTRSLQETASSPGPHMNSGSGSLALQRQQLVQQLQNWRGTLVEEEHAAEGTDIDIDNLRSVSETEQMMVKHLQQQNPPPLSPQQQKQTGHAAAARAQETANEQSANAIRANSTRHQPYYALWSNVASALAEPSESALSPDPDSHTHQVAGPAGPTAAVIAEAAAAAAISYSTARPGGVRPSPFAASAVVAAALDNSSPSSSGSPQAGVGSVCVPSTAQAVGPIVAPVTTAAASQDTPTPPARHAAYYNMWQSAAGGISAEGLSNPTSPAAAGATATTAALQDVNVQPQPHETASAAAPGRHKQYINMWQAAAEEIGDGPSAVGAQVGPVNPALPEHVAAAIAATRQPQPAGKKVSPFAAMAAAAAAAGLDDPALADPSAASAEQQRQRLQRRRSSRPSRRGGRHSSTAGASDGGSDASAYDPVGSGNSQA